MAKLSYITPKFKYIIIYYDVIIIYIDVPYQLECTFYKEHSLENMINTTVDTRITLVIASSKSIRQLKISEIGVREVIKQLLKHTYNCFSFEELKKSHVVSVKERHVEIKNTPSSIITCEPYSNINKCCNCSMQQDSNIECVKVEIGTDSENKKHNISNINVCQVGKYLLKKYTVFRRKKVRRKKKRKHRNKERSPKCVENAVRFNKHDYKFTQNEHVTNNYSSMQNYLKKIRDVGPRLEDADKAKQEELLWIIEEITSFPKIMRLDLFVYSGRRKHTGTRGKRNPPSRSDDTKKEEPHNPPCVLPIQAQSDPSPNLADQKIVTSITTVYEPYSSRSIIPVTNQQTNDASRTLALRLHGNLPASRFSRPNEPPRHPQYRDQTARQQSYTSWPATTGQDPSTMVSYGFFYTGRFDLIRCFQCGIGLKDWEASDEPLFEHIKHSPECLFLKELLGEESLRAHRASLLARQLGQQTEFPTASNLTGPRQLQASTTTNTDGSSIPPVRHPQYAKQEARIQTFVNWPSSAGQSTNVMAEAGMFYTGIADLCRCFTCDGGLQNWDIDDDPWLEHARWFPNCAYVKQIKGERYVNLVQEAVRMARQEEEESAVINPPPGILGALSSLHVEDPLTSAAAKTVLALGFSEQAVRWAINEVKSKAGDQNLAYTSDDLVRALKERQDRGEPLPTDFKEGSSVHGAIGGFFSSDPAEENRQLKHIIKCMVCCENDSNILFLPCTHHRMCDVCAKNINVCPVCKKKISEKIRTFMS